MLLKARLVLARTVLQPSAFCGQAFLYFLQGLGPHLGLLDATVIKVINIVKCFIKQQGVFHFHTLQP